MFYILHLTADADAGCIQDIYDYNSITRRTKMKALCELRVLTYVHNAEIHYKAD